ncbi:MAG: cysteine synthase family protein [Elusimicrobia bacterium]|nr:cysteine synthase family protein [Elusimicrobiota bacterium]
MKTGASLPSQHLRVGDTPLIELQGLSPALSRRVRLFAKGEWHNPGGSVKDRAGLRIIQEAERAGLMGPKKVLLDATSGNTGIAYSWICAALGYKVTLTVPGSIAPLRRAILESYGAELMFTSPLEGTDGAIREARLIQAAEPSRYFYADQYNNENNWRAHYDTTAVEILAQTKNELTHFVAGLGTSGTFTGTSRRLRKLAPKVKLHSVEPDAALHGLDGLKHMATAIIPGIYDDKLADEKMAVSTDEAQAVCRKLAKDRGLLVGPSGGANVAASLRLAERLAEEGANALIVTILPDNGERYLSERFWKE